MSAWRAPLRHPGVAIAFLLPVTMAACGRSDAPPAQDTAGKSQAAATVDDSFDPCALVTTAEVAAAVGWQPTKVEPAKYGNGMGKCDYSTADSMAMPPQKVSVGIEKCPYNMPCYEDLPKFKSSQELAQYRLKGYEGAYEGAAKVDPLEGWGVPAIHQDMLGLHSVELYVAPNRLAYVTTFTDLDIAKGMAKKMQARIH